MTPKEAVAAAVAYAAELYGESVVDIRLEEVDKAGSRWKITLSWLRATSPTGSKLAPILMTQKPRSVRVFTVDDTDGEVLSMVMRDKDKL